MEQFKDKVVTSHYKNGITYMQSMEYPSKWAEYERFLNSDQWAKVSHDSKTKNLPRPVFNIIRYIVDHKKASIQSENLKMVFTPEEVYSDFSHLQQEDISKLELALTGAKQFTKYSETVWENIQQARLNDEMLMSCCSIGTGILHYFWDNSITGGITLNYKGEIAGENLDPSNVFFGNPQVTDVQKQPYILISSRELLETVLEEAKRNNVPEHYISLIKEDDDTSNEIYDTAKTEVRGVKKVNVLTEYYKKNGQVYFKKVCNEIVITPETNTGLRLYPIALMNYKIRKKSIYGIGDVEGLIPNQKAINFNLAMMILSTQNCAFPKILAKPGSLKQKITNTPGEIITDYYVGGADGIKFMNTGAFNPMSLTLTDKLCDLTKEFSNANESALGNAIGADMSAQAIMLLQKASGTSLEDIKARFYRCMEDVGRIWLEFWCTKYNLPRPIRVKDRNGAYYTEIMEGTQYREYPYNVRIDVGSSASYSEITQQASLDKLFDGGHIDVLTYIKYSSDNNMPNKESLMNDIMERQQSMLMANDIAPQGQSSVGAGKEFDELMAQEEGMPLEDGMPELGISDVKPPSMNYIKSAGDVREHLPGIR